MCEGLGEESSRERGSLIRPLHSPRKRRASRLRIGGVASKADERVKPKASGKRCIDVSIDSTVPQVFS